MLNKMCMHEVSNRICFGEHSLNPFHSGVKQGMKHFIHSAF
jgi:hypothetical protein